MPKFAWKASRCASNRRPSAQQMKASSLPSSCAAAMSAAHSSSKGSTIGVGVAVGSIALGVGVGSAMGIAVGVGVGAGGGEVGVGVGSLPQAAAASAATLARAAVSSSLRFIIAVPPRGRFERAAPAPVSCPRQSHSRRLVSSKPLLPPQRRSWAPHSAIRSPRALAFRASGLPPARCEGRGQMGAVLFGVASFGFNWLHSFGRPDGFWGLALYLSYTLYYRGACRANLSWGSGEWAPTRGAGGSWAPTRDAPTGAPGSVKASGPQWDKMRPQ